MKRILGFIVVFIFFISASYGQCASGYGMASSWTKKSDYCKYLYVKVTNTTNTKQKIVIEIKKDNGKWQFMGAKTVQSGKSYEVNTCTNRTSYRWAVVDPDCYKYKSKWKYGDN